jgi:hypothetical protein
MPTGDQMREFPAAATPEEEQKEEERSAPRAPSIDRCPGCGYASGHAPDCPARSR